MPQHSLRLGASQNNSENFGEDINFLLWRESKHDSPCVHPGAYSVHRLRYPCLKEIDKDTYRATDSVGGFRRSFFRFRRKGNSRAQWPRVLRRVSAAARLLRLRFRISLGACLSLLSVVCCHVEIYVFVCVRACVCVSLRVI
jgi:hypothetical protein